jgi:hypothetical protein
MKMAACGVVDEMYTGSWVLETKKAYSTCPEYHFLLSASLIEYIIRNNAFAVPVC